MVRLNNNPYNLRFTVNMSAVEMVFLDIPLKVQEGRIHTWVHWNSSACNSTVHFKSQHLKNLKESIPYGKTLRLGKICIQEEEFIRQMSQMKGRFKREVTHQRY